ncbi:hypothetical protein [Streptomyces sp. NPDC057199]|uniref:hypothetical protein n=1 Tax=Streptomyces sp. NPDC057199 TaxID=3346047 RepID=UPI00364025E6
MTDTHHTVPYPRGPVYRIVADEHGTVRPPAPSELGMRTMADGPDVVEALRAREFAAGRIDWATGATPFPDECAAQVDRFAARVLLVPRSERWREALSTALMGTWCEALTISGGQLPVTAVGVLKAEARVVHRQLVPVWRRRTRHGRVLSLDAALADGLSLYDLVAADVDLLERVTGGVCEDERLNAVLRGLDSAECDVVLALAAQEGTTWAEAASAAGAADPEAFGERVRRKTKRLAAEQRRRTGLRNGSPAAP